MAAAAAACDCGPKIGSSLNTKRTSGWALIRASTSGAASLQCGQR